MHLHVVKVYDGEQRLLHYATAIDTRHKYRHLMIYLRFYCNKLKHRPFYEVKDVIMKHFLRFGVYLDTSVFQLIIFFIL
jgi:hypothetical protein